MDPLSVNTFTGAVDDVERTQYKILGGLQRAQEAFHQKRVYPHLGRLVKLHGALVSILKQTQDFRTPTTGRISGIDWKEQTVTYQWPDLEETEMAVVEDLIRWALPHIRDTIEDGTAVYEHVDENLALETVGIVPSYVEEGYLMVPHREAGALHVLRYTLSLIDGDGETHRALKTTHCKTVHEADVGAAPSAVKLTLIEERRDLPTPATYFSNIDLHVPYRETLLPVVKRRLVRRLAAEGGGREAQRQ
jgi:hypothetical protein